MPTSRLDGPNTVDEVVGRYVTPTQLLDASGNIKFCQWLKNQSHSYQRIGDLFNPSFLLVKPI